MSFKIPPYTSKYKLIATYRSNGDIWLAMLIDEEPFNFKWSELGSIQDLELKNYLSSLQSDIEAGRYEIENH
ncbi:MULTISPECIES: hypothetical protein [Oceanobacillus]|uniref:Uncharacterized protein n=1 Tax=Oceanobacillus kimchii TaxID=746691 RepID=A0ABQ5THQ0_9BACI|nr:MULTISPECIES: hypothetical protein [Oceanobacillus]MBT2600627.1 hypothetical protein [Oceanobacillus sp. ISL-74]MBT2650976.1 hypothetical protein [Oceanobacillus sp. ISL-73]MCT1578958.1 hypothetical protein [Oceanobacillus kimchii]MCT2137883.1 hypothetical protein [Oceanobacillus kimchii]OEH53425.1 hypothetical protein AQ616_17155 [Oceanobacillus sp. E9]